VKKLPLGRIGIKVVTIKIIPESKYLSLVLKYELILLKSVKIKNNTNEI